MIEKAVRKWNIDRSKSFMIGDNRVDFLCAKNQKFIYYKERMNLLNQVKKS